MTIKNLEDAYMAQIEKLKAELEAERAKALDLEFNLDAFGGWLIEKKCPPIVLLELKRQAKRSTGGGFMSEASREMTLEEYVNKLPDIHLSYKEYQKLKAELEARNKLLRQAVPWVKVYCGVDRDDLDNKRQWLKEAKEVLK